MLSGLLSVGSDAELAGHRARSHLHDGRVVAWTGSYDVPVAVDAEVPREVPAALARRFGTDRFWERWTRAECVAKLTGRGVVDLVDLMAAGDAGTGVRLSTVRLSGGIVVSVGWSSTEAGKPRVSGQFTYSP
ncbi:4-phosphopantetheinyl transferase family protein [Nocardioides albus]|uniref:Uncharacterized protein n=1 Tax=Nocardioides albus TaxID=1841 RepID=A0A7W5A6G2_9ACTN|nr:4-phosphopantetheinyl transferase family protein [Nocardioides albus]MBB3090456.1 hypothetical protein [Nocardioides albus]GGU24035.1 hypothetical protein GCM10007979_23400 [Nocardioides albus]